MSNSCYDWRVDIWSLASSYSHVQLTWSKHLHVLLVISRQLLSLTDQRKKNGVKPLCITKLKGNTCRQKKSFHHHTRAPSIDWIICSSFPTLSIALIICFLHQQGSFCLQGRISRIIHFIQLFIFTQKNLFCLQQEWNQA